MRRRLKRNRFSYSLKKTINSLASSAVSIWTSATRRQSAGESVSMWRQSSTPAFPGVLPSITINTGVRIRELVTGDDFGDVGGSIDKSSFYCQLRTSTRNAYQDVAMARVCLSV